VTAFGRLPVLSEGRMKPLDSVARSTLLVIQGRQRVMTPDDRELTPDEWLLDVLFFPERRIPTGCSSSTTPTCSR